MMGYGTISGNSSAHAAVPAIIPNRQQATMSPHLVRVHMIRESTSLIRRRRRRDESVLNWRIGCLILILVCGVFIGIHQLILEYKESEPNHPFHLIDREVWGIVTEFYEEKTLNGSLVSSIVLFHTQTDVCHNFRSCLNIINVMQNESAADLMYNFLIGGDGMTYEVRGWDYQSGFDIPNKNSSLVVGLIGNFTTETPQDVQLYEIDALISESIRREKLNSEYKIFGARHRSQITFDGQKMFEVLENFFLKWHGIIT